MMAHDLPPHYVVFQQTQRWLKAGGFEVMVHDLRSLLRLMAGKKPDPMACIIDSRTLQSGSEAGYDGNKRKEVSFT